MSIVHARKKYIQKLSWINGSGLATRWQGAHGFVFIIHYIPSIEGFNHPIIFTDSNSGMRWQYGMKTKDETLDMPKRWCAEIADIRINYTLIMVVRDKAARTGQRNRTISSQAMG